jgi:hypothetical protein
MTSMECRGKLNKLNKLTNEKLRKQINEKKFWFLQALLSLIVLPGHDILWI